MTALRVAALLATALCARGDSILFQDNFGTPGTHLNYSLWDTVTGAPSFLGRTQLANWNSGGGGQFVVAADGAHLALSTYNPTGFSLYGTQAMTLESFQPAANATIEFDSVLQLTSLQPGLVYGMYLYGCDPSTCANDHDEIDIEVLTNSLQPGNTPMVELNRYAAEPLGAGNGGLVDLPAGFDPLAAHKWSILWSATSVEYLVDGIVLGVDTTHVPQGPMQVNEIAWGPASDWAAAYSAALQPVGLAQQNQTFAALLTSVTVSQTPEPGSWILALTGFGVAGLAFLARIGASHRRILAHSAHV